MSTRCNIYKYEDNNLIKRYETELTFEELQNFTEAFQNYWFIADSDKGIIGELEGYELNNLLDVEEFVMDDYFRVEISY